MQKAEIIKQLHQNYQSFIETIEHLEKEAFDKNVDSKWTPGQQLLHLYLSIKPLKTAFGLPKIILRLVFGKAKNGSRTYENLVADYQQKLAAGGKSSKPFTPQSVDYDQKTMLTRKIEHTMADISKKLTKYSETDLDRLQLPHPLLGKLTLREMLFFTMYHAEHHKKSCIQILETSKK